MAGQPIGRFYALQKEASVPEPYVLTSKIKIPMPTMAQMNRWRTATNDDDANRAFFGAHADAVFELYADRPVAEWQAFTAEVWQHFFGPGVNDVEGKSAPSSE